MSMGPTQVLRVGPKFRHTPTPQRLKSQAAQATPHTSTRSRSEPVQGEQELSQQAAWPSQIRHRSSRPRFGVGQPGCCEGP